jgi:hypothetical protein
MLDEMSALRIERVPSRRRFRLHLPRVLKSAIHSQASVALGAPLNNRSRIRPGVQSELSAKGIALRLSSPRTHLNRRRRQPFVRFKPDRVLVGEEPTLSKRIARDEIHLREINSLTQPQSLL